MLISGAPVIGHPLLEQTVQPLMRSGWDAAFADFEFWTARRDCFESLLERLVPFERVLMLSGDVHYGFSASMQYWNRRGATTVPAIFVQLCSSAFSNEDGKTNLLADSFLVVVDPPALSEFVGWTNPGPYVSVSTSVGGGVPWPTTITVPGRPAIFERATGPVSLTTDAILTPGDWSYRVRFHHDPRTGAARGFPPFGSVPVQPQERLGYQHRRRSWEGHRVVVGKDNLGAISFEWGAEKRVLHELWYALDQQDASLLSPYTRHIVGMDPPAVGEAPG